MYGGKGDLHRDGYRSIIQQLQTMMHEHVHDKSCRTPPGEMIVCKSNWWGSICAAQQHTRGGKLFPDLAVHRSQSEKVVPGLNATQTIDLLQGLIDHGCKACGSVAVGYPQNADPNPYGVLTVNMNAQFLTPYRNGPQYYCQMTTRPGFFDEPFESHEMRNMGYGST